MSGHTEDAELDAIKQILGALSSLDAEGQQRALEYVFERLKIVPPASNAMPYKAVPVVPELNTPPTVVQSIPTVPTDIRTFTENKQPRSANEMAAVVAYYLEYEAPEAERKGTISSEDIEKYFHLAKYQKPGNPNMTLTHSKNSGYLDQQDRGQYKLNPVGYNLVAHKLPAGGAVPARKVTKRPKKAMPKKSKK